MSINKTRYDHRYTAQHVAALTEVNVQDMLAAFGVDHLRMGRRLLSLLCQPAARRFANQVLQCDQRVGEFGLQAGGAWSMQRFDAALTISGQANLPARGPLLIVSNHPGMTDTVALFASIARPDLRIVAASRPFLELLPNFSRHLIYVDEQRASSTGVVRSVVTHLASGGCVLTFPAGKIEPDPALKPGAIAALEQWSTSIDLFTRLTPEVMITPALVSGVISPRATRSRLTRLRRSEQGRERLAAMLQLIVPAFRAVQARVSFGPTAVGADLLANPGPAPVTAAMAAAMANLILSLAG